MPEEEDEENYLLSLDRKLGKLQTCVNFVEGLQIYNTVEKYDSCYIPVKPSSRFVQGADSYGRDITKVLNKDGYLSFYLVKNDVFQSMMEDIEDDQGLNWWTGCTLN